MTISSRTEELITVLSYQIILIYLIISQIYLVDTGIYLLYFEQPILISKIVAICFISTHFYSSNGLNSLTCIMFIWYITTRILQLLYLFITCLQLYKYFVTNNNLLLYVIWEFVNNSVFLSTIIRFNYHNNSENVDNTPQDEIENICCCCMCIYNLIYVPMRCIYIVIINPLYICISLLVNNCKQLILYVYDAFILCKNMCIKCCKLLKCRKKQPLSNKTTSFNSLCVNILIDSNTSHKLPNELSNEFKASICTICLDGIPDNKKKTLPACGHFFCNECIEQHFKKCNEKCPNCRKRIIHL